MGLRPHTQRAQQKGLLGKLLCCWRPAVEADRTTSLKSVSFKSVSFGKNTKFVDGIHQTSDCAVDCINASSAGGGDSFNGDEAQYSSESKLSLKQQQESLGTDVVSPAKVGFSVSAIFADPAESISKNVLHCTSNFPLNLRRRNWSMNDFEVVQLLHCGYASFVYQAYCPLLNQSVALKIYDMGRLDPLARYQVNREVNIHTSLNHRHIVDLLIAFQDGDKLVLVEEFADAGDLVGVVRRNGGRLSEKITVKNVVQPLLEALNYLHANEIVHRDIKPKNILFNSLGELKLADFGVAIDLSEETAVTNVGTQGFMAPEVLKCPFKQSPEENKTNRELVYSTTADAWSVGMLVYRLICGTGQHLSKSANLTESNWDPSTISFLDTTSELAKDFICQALQLNPQVRTTVQQMLRHPWLKTVQPRLSVDFKEGDTGYSGDVSMEQRPELQSADHVDTAISQKRVFQGASRVSGRHANSSPRTPASASQVFSTCLSDGANGFCGFSGTENVQATYLPVKAVSVRPSYL